MSAIVKKVPIHLQSSQNRLLVKNGQVVNADGITDSDVYIEDGIIRQLGRNLIIPGGTRVIDARGMYVMPGGIDPHTHMEVELFGSKSADDFYQGTKAAVAGGTTMIIDFALPTRGESLLNAYNTWRERADEKVCCDYGLHVGITWWSEEVKKEMEKLVKNNGINSFKMFMAYKETLMINDAELYEAVVACKELGAIPMVHAENGDIVYQNVKRLIAEGVKGPEGHELSRTEEVEAEAVNRACVIANQVSSPLYVVHVMSESAAVVVAKYSEKDDSKIYGETLAAALGTCTAHLCGKLSSKLALHVMSPPIRPKESTPVYLMHQLALGGLQVTGSDNCTYTTEQKHRGKDDFRQIPHGVNGVEDRMSVVWEKGVHAGVMDVTRFVAVTSTNAAKIFNIFPKKGCIAIGSDADIVVWNHRKTRVISAKTHHHATDYNIFEGLECHGVPEYVIVNGRVCVDEGELKAVQGFGHFVPTPPFPPFVYGEGLGEDMPSVMVSPNGEQKVEKVTDELNLSDAINNAVETASISSAKSVHGRSPPVSSSASIIGDSEPLPFTTGKAMRQEGQRNLQDSTFSISAELDDSGHRACIRVKNPPGGQSSGGFW